ncbi:hypothetical protein IFM89_035379 [Coptis chinensis]|uniref:Uncharacterized protein n=1 Tax=Coptis chinensis TaxID=261450 RepID=A0A835IWQ7_9MAGN|nr:hypothetical protein IFM89_035379 [Coptis chinensis]
MIEGMAVWPIVLVPYWDYSCIPAFRRHIFMNDHEMKRTARSPCAQIISFAQFHFMYIYTILSPLYELQIHVKAKNHEFWQTVEVGKLPKRCTHCNIVGHLVTECKRLKGVINTSDKGKQVVVDTTPPPEDNGWKKKRNRRKGTTSNKATWVQKDAPTEPQGVNNRFSALSETQVEPEHQEAAAEEIVEVEQIHAMQVDSNEDGKKDSGLRALVRAGLLDSPVNMIVSPPRSPHLVVDFSMYDLSKRTTPIIVESASMTVESHSDAIQNVPSSGSSTRHNVATTVEKEATQVLNLLNSLDKAVMSKTCDPPDIASNSLRRTS